MEEVRRIRKERKLTQDQLAELANVDRPSLSLIETGRRTPTVDTLEKLAVALGVEVADFFPRAQPDLFTSTAGDELGPIPPVEFVAMSRATPDQRRRALGEASGAEIREYVRAIDRALDSADRWGRDEQDKEALAAYKAFLHDLRAETDPFDVLPPTPDQRAAIGAEAGLAV